MKNKIKLLLFLLILLNSCQSIKDGISGAKQKNSDEFLVEKKNPLAMPPDYEKLPTPGNQEVSPETFSDNDEVKDLLNVQDSNEIDSNNDSNNTANIESSIIEKIQ